MASSSVAAREIIVVFILGIFGKLMNYSGFVTNLLRLRSYLATQAKQDITPVVANSFAERR